MKKSAHVPASMILALAATFASSGCGSSSSRVCEDFSGRVLPDSACINGTPGAHWVVQRGGFGGSGYRGGYYPGASFGS